VISSRHVCIKSEYDTATTSFPKEYFALKKENSRPDLQGFPQKIRYYSFLLAVLLIPLVLLEREGLLWHTFIYQVCYALCPPGEKASER
jgi:hypothetical protein